MTTPSPAPGDLEQQLAAQRRLLPLVEPPPLVSQRLRRLASVRFGTARTLVRVVAERVTDTRRLGRPAGVRCSRTDATSRYQLTFAAAGIATVIVDVAEPDDGHGLVLRGQVLAEVPTLPVFEATVWGPSGVVTTILGDELGGFEVRGVPKDADTILVTNDELEIRMSLDLRSTGRPSDGERLDDESLDGGA